MSEARQPLALPRDTPSDFATAVSVFLSHWSPRVLITGVLVTCAARVALGAPGPADLLLPLAVLLGWPLLEWLIHVYVLHFRPRTVFGLRVDPINARRHRAHHLDPWRFKRAFVPVRSLLLIQFTMLSLAALSPWPALWSCAAAITLLALRYEWVHYLCHIRYCPRSQRYRTLVQNHRRHHFKSEKYWLGVSMLSGDRLLGTDGDPREVERSATVRTIHGPQLA